MITGALILLVGIAIGMVLRSFPARRKAPKPVEAVCGCKHHHAMHDAETGACKTANRGRPVKWSAGGEPVKWEWVNCPCVRYSGPVPLPEYFAPEIAGEAGQ